MSAPRQFWIDKDAIRKNPRGEIYEASTVMLNKERDIHVREVIKCEACGGLGMVGGYEGNPPEPVGYPCELCSRDALFDEMLGALKKVRSEIVRNLEGTMYWVDIQDIDAVIKKAEGKE